MEADNEMDLDTGHPIDSSLTTYEVRRRKFIDEANKQAIKLTYLRNSHSSEKYKASNVMSNEDMGPDDHHLESKVTIKKGIGQEENKLFPRQSIMDRNVGTNLRLNPYVVKLGRANSDDNSLIEMDHPRRKSVISTKKFMKRPSQTLPASLQTKGLIKKTELFHRQIMKVAQMNKRKLLQENRKVILTEREINLNTFQKVNILRYRENVFKAASNLTTKLPPFPQWSYKNKPQSAANRIKFNVSGMHFEVFDETLMNLPHTKLTDSYLYHSRGSTLFFDRDPSCFNAILNFYRTGKLHAPANSCLSFFEEELLFWGLSEDLMEPCCYSDFQANKHICDTLNSYMESMKKPEYAKGKNKYFVQAQQTCNLISVSEKPGIFGKFYTLFYAMAIMTTIVTLIFNTSSLGRVDIKTKKLSDQEPEETLLHYFKRTEVNPSIRIIDILLNAFFIMDFIMRFVLCSKKLLFISDIMNWADLLVIISSVLSELPVIRDSEDYESYPLILKIPRMFRLFRISKNLRFGMDAFILTLRTSSAELVLVFIITVITICFYGVFIYVVELINEYGHHHSSFKSIYEGMWWAIVTMSTVGYGDFVPNSSYGFVVGYFCILTGIIITQLPVPIFLKNFSTYYNQIEARMQLVNTVLISTPNPTLIEGEAPENQEKHEKTPKLKAQVSDE